MLRFVGCYCLLWLLVSAETVASEYGNWRSIARGYARTIGDEKHIQGLLTYAITPELAYRQDKLRAKFGDHCRWHYETRRVQKILRLGNLNAKQNDATEILARVWTAEALANTISIFGVDHLSPEVPAVLAKDEEFYREFASLIVDLGGRLDAHQPSMFEIIDREQNQSFVEGLIGAAVEGMLQNAQQSQVEAMLSGKLREMVARERSKGWELISEGLRGHQQPGVYTSGDFEISVPTGPRLPQQNIMVTNRSSGDLNDILVTIDNQTRGRSFTAYYAENWKAGLSYNLGVGGNLNLSSSQTRQLTPVHMLICDRQGLIIRNQMTQRCRSRVHEYQPTTLKKILLDAYAVGPSADAPNKNIAAQNLETFIEITEKQITRVERTLATRIKGTRRPEHRERFLMQLHSLAMGQFPDWCREKEEKAFSKLVKQFAAALKRIEVKGDDKETVESVRNQLLVMYGPFLEEMELELMLRVDP